MRIGIDLMGGDTPPHLLFPAVLHAAGELHESDFLEIIATPDVLNELSGFLKRHPTQAGATIHLQAASDAVAMDDDPLHAVRRKRGSSMAVGISLLAVKSIDALISCGNTGALIAGAAIHLPLYPGTSRPALIARLPTAEGRVAVLDVGGNIDCKPEQLFQFALLGATYLRSSEGIGCPRVGLLNVGTEARKGTQLVRETYGLLEEFCKAKAGMQETPMKFVGNIEGRDVFRGTVDLLVTDGFSGNILLKTAEGAAAFVLDSLASAAAGEASTAFRRHFEEIKSRFAYTCHPGALLAGVDGVVVKVHGDAAPASLIASIRMAADYVRIGLAGKMLGDLTAFGR